MRIVEIVTALFDAQPSIPILMMIGREFNQPASLLILMPTRDPIGQALAIADVSLREFFPNDFYKRCMYASFGVAALLKDEGISAHLSAGDFICTVVSRNGMQMSLQGFGASSDGAPSHYWVSAHEHLLDLGPMYLPYESSFPAASLPILRWPTAIKLPDFILYRERERYAEGVEITNPTFRDRKAAFLSHCRKTRDSKEDFQLPAWQLKSMQSLRFAAQKGDPWAQASIEFIRRSLKAEFPHG